MSYQSTTYVACVDLQDDLDRFFQTCSAENLRRDTPFLDFLLSPANRSGLSQTIAPGQGRVRNAELVYGQRILETDVLENQTNPNCTATTKRGNCSEDYTIDTENNVQIEELISPADFKEVCKDNGEIWVEKIAKMRNALMRKLATKIAGELPALVGGWGAETQNVVGDVLQVQTLRAGTPDEPYAYTTEEIDRAIEMSAYCDNTIVIGGQELYRNYRLRNAGCCADYGINIDDLWSQYANPFMFDKRVANAFSAGNKLNENVVIQRGALQLLLWTFNPIHDVFKDQVGPAQQWQKLVITDPDTGMPIDLNISEEKCGDISVVMTATAELKALPSDLFPTGDEYENVSFTGRVQVANT